LVGKVQRQALGQPSGWPFRGDILMRFASETKIEINRLLDGEPLFRILPALSGRESEEEILTLLKSKIDRLETVDGSDHYYELRNQE